MLHQLKANQLKGLVRLGMVRRITEHMKVAPVIVALVAINMMYVFSALGSSNNAVFKYPAAPASPSALGVKRYTMRPVALCRGRSGADIGEYKMTANRLGYIPAPKLRPWLHSSDLATVRKACIAVLPPHLVVTHAHFTSGNRAFAVLAIPSDLLPSPSVLSGSVALDTLVVHKAEPMSSVLLFTARSHLSLRTMSQWYVGQKVVCVSSRPYTPIVEGQIYTVTGFDRCCSAWLFVNVEPGPGAKDKCPLCGQGDGSDFPGCGFLDWRFRPLDPLEEQLDRIEKEAVTTPELQPEPLPA